MTAVTVSGYHPDCAIGSDICELASGTLLTIQYGCPTTWNQATANVRVFKSTDSGVTWTYLSQVVTASFNGYGCLEPQLRLLADGTTLICTFHTADSAQTHYWTKSTNGGSSWTTPTSILATGNRAGLLTHPADQDLIFCYTSGTTAYLKTSTDNAATFGAALSLGTGNSGYIGGVWSSPFSLTNSTSLSPDLGVVYGFETVSQAQSEVYYRALTPAVSGYVQRTRTVTADALVSSGVAVTRTSTITADAVVTATYTRTFSADASIAAAIVDPGDPGNLPDPGPDTFRMYFNLGPYL